MKTAATAVETAVTTWKIDPVHSHAQFKVKHMMISHVKGEFTSISGTLELNEDEYAKSKVQASVDATTINTRDQQRDGHLKSPDFFDVEKFPTLHFVSTVIEPQGSGYAVTGNLTIHGVTKKVTFEVEEVSGPAKDPWGNVRIGLSAMTKINRKDFGLVWNSTLESGGFLVGDDVTISVDAEFVRS